jgi:Mrp family chromosome partitioning ATPase
MKSMLKALAENATVLIDAPPLLPVTDAAVLTRVADGAIVVIRTGRTTQDQLAQSMGNLDKVKGRVLGAVLNYVPTRGTDSYSYYGTYAAAPEEQASTLVLPSGSLQYDAGEGSLEAAFSGHRARG